MSVAYREVNEAWIVGAVRSPIGRHSDSLSSIRPDDLGALVLEALVERTGVPPEEVEDVYMVGVGHGDALAVESGSQP
jgi:acetyl-CoA acetyltransferase